MRPSVPSTNILQENRICYIKTQKILSCATMKAVMQSHVTHWRRKPSAFFMSQAFRRAVDDVVLQRLVQRNERRRKARHADTQALVLLRLRLRGDQLFA